MGVNGLWGLLEPSGKAVPVETLENKVLAVDVSIWLHQATKGFQDAGGNPMPNAHLLGLFHRLCKLLFYKIKPVFVFDGGVPHLKKQTVAARRQRKSKAELNAERVREQLLKNLLKHKAVKRALGEQAGPSEVSLPRTQREDDMFDLPTPPAMQLELQSEEECGSESEDSPQSHKHHKHDLHTMDVTSTRFKSLPADVRHDILTELKETRKQNSWGRLHEMPEESGQFSNYQMNRLLKRRSVQVSLEEAEKEMGGKTMNLGELEELLNEHGVLTGAELDLGRRIASNNTMRYIYVNGTTSEVANSKVCSKEENDNPGKTPSNETEQENESNKDEPQTEMNNDSLVEIIDEDDSFVELIDEDDYEDEWFPEMIDEYKSSENNVLSEKLKLARNFMFENSGLTQEQILAVIKSQNSPEKNKKSKTSFTSIQSSSKETKNVGSVITNLNFVGISGTECSAKDTGNVTSNQVESQEIINVEETHRALETMHHNEENTKDKSDVSMKPVEIKSKVVVNSITAENAEPIICSDKESSSEDNIEFVEVEDIPASVLSWQDKKVQPLEVVIQPNHCDEEEDIFADIFSQSVGPNESKVRSVEVKEVHSVSKDNNENKYKEITVNKDDLSHTESTLKNKTVFNLPVQNLKPSLNIASRCTPNEFVNSKEVGDSYEDESGKVVVVRESRKEEGNRQSSKEEETRQSSKEEENRQSSKEEENRQSSKEEERELTTADESPKAHKPLPENKMSTEQLQRLQESLENEHDLLLSQKIKQDRLAASITDQMYMEAQELLQLFGVPYIIAPMEAEAQCAFLDLISLTDGTITDDSDIWLFGGQKVYKNFFNQKKHVLQFRATDIFHYFKLAREQLVLLALLVGSDYTTGLQGVGPVTALEILAAFHSEMLEDPEPTDVLQSLKNFQEWWASGRMAGKATLRNKLKDIRLHEGFPSIAVVEAYLKPKVDDSKEKLSWSAPDLAALRIYAREKFGWPRNKIDDILLPVMKKLNEKTNQQSLDSYFQARAKLPLAEGKLSKRVEQAVKRIGGKGDSNPDSDEPVSKSRRPGPIAKAKARQRSRGKGRGLGLGRSRGFPVLAVLEEPEFSGGVRPRRGQELPAPDQGGPSVGKEFILQREKDKLNALKNKLKAIEVFRTSKKGLDKTKRQKRAKRQELLEANLSESSSD